MDKFQFVRDGVTRLPPGFRFQPTDEELVFQYLKCKIFSLSLPAPIIPDINVYKHDPWDLPAGNLEQERYFFSNKEAKYPNGNRINRATASGYWKATGLDKQIISSSSNNQMVGMKKTLVFYRGKPPHESRTDWIMHEYRLVSTATTQNYSKEMENWVICRIFLKKRSMKDDENADKNGVMQLTQPQPQFFDFMMRDKNALCAAATSSCSSTSSCSGKVEALYDADDDDDAESSGRNNF